MSDERLEVVRSLAAQLRVDSIRCSTQAGSGHPTSSLSAADLMAVLLSAWGCHRPRAPDRVVFDKLVQVVVLGVAYKRIADSVCSATTDRCRGAAEIDGTTAACLVGLALRRRELDKGVISASRPVVAPVPEYPYGRP